MKMTFFKTTLVLLLVTGSGQIVAQEKQKSKMQQWKEFMEEARRTEREEEETCDSLYHCSALDALKEGNFVLESDKVAFKYGDQVFVNSSTNFISLHDGVATIQVSPYLGGGPNGVGGVTVEGRPSGVRVSTDRKGITHLSMNVMGHGVSVQVNMILYPSDDRATATVRPNFHSFNVTLSGRLVHFRESRVFKGSVF